MARLRSPSRVARFLGLSVLGHAALYLVILGTGLDRGCTRAPTEGEAWMGGDGAGSDWDLACLADAATQAAAQALLCQLPGVHALPLCREPAWDRLELDQIACRRVAAPLDVAMIDPKVLDPFASPKDEAAEDKAAKDKIDKAKQAEDDPNEHQQVVDIDQPKVEIRPDDTKLASIYDSKVDHETIAKHPNSTPAAATAFPSKAPEPGPVAAPAPSPVRALPTGAGEGGSGDKALGMRTIASSGSPTGELTPEKDGVLPARGSDNGQPGADASAPQGPAGVAQGGMPGAEGKVNLRPSAVAGTLGGGADEYLPDVDEGQTTLLNTKRWKYSGFFDRVKRGVYVNWHPDVIYAMRDPTGQIYGKKTRLTVLKVSLKPDGGLEDVLIEQPSGVDFLDDEAVDAMKKASPFPNPPAGLIDKKSNLITFRFGFYFEISDSPSYKVFRYSN